MAYENIIVGVNKYNEGNVSVELNMEAVELRLRVLVHFYKL